MAEETKNTEELEQTSAPSDSKAAKKRAKAKKEKKAKSHKVSSYIKDLKSELHKITWYSRKDTVKSTILVCVIMVVFAAVIALVDYLFGSGIALLGDLFN